MLSLRRIIICGLTGQSRTIIDIHHTPGTNDMHRHINDIKRSSSGAVIPIGVNRPAIVREIPHVGFFPAFPHFCKNVPHFWLYFETTKIGENRNNFRCMEILSSKKLFENVNDSVTKLIKILLIQKSLKIAKKISVGVILFEKALRKRQW